MSRYNSEIDSARYEEGKAALFVVVAWLVISITTGLVRTGVV